MLPGLGQEEAEGTDGSPPPLVRIISPHEYETYTLATIDRKSLVWNDERKEMSAMITFSNRQYKAMGDELEMETLQFYLPGLQYDAAEKLFFVTGRGGERIPFARRKQKLLASSIEPERNAVVRVVRMRNQVNVYAEIYPAAYVEAEEQKRVAALGTNETHQVPLNIPLDIGGIVRGSGDGGNAEDRRGQRPTDGRPGTRWGEKR